MKLPNLGIPSGTCLCSMCDIMVSALGYGLSALGSTPGQGQVCSVSLSVPLLTQEICNGLASHPGGRGE